MNIRFCVSSPCLRDHRCASAGGRHGTFISTLELSKKTCTDGMCVTADTSPCTGRLQTKRMYACNTRHKSPCQVQSDSATFGAGLGLILGTRIYYSFVGCEHEDDVVFEKRLDPLVREIGDRGMARFAPTGVSEGVPPSPTPAPARSAPALAPASRPVPAPNLAAAPVRSVATLVPAPDLAPTSTVAVAPDPAPALAPGTAAAVAPIRVPDQSVTSTTQMVPLEHLYALLEREWAQQQQMKADITAAHEQAKAATEKVREEVMQKELITTEQLAALQSRLEILHTEQLLTDEEIFALEVRTGTCAALMSRA